MTASRTTASKTTTGQTVEGVPGPAHPVTSDHETNRKAAASAKATAIREASPKVKAAVAAKAPAKSAAKAPAKVTAAKAAPAKAAPAQDVAAAKAAAAAARLAAVPEERRTAILRYLPVGYDVIWPKGSWSTLHANAKAPEDAPKWMIMCNLHGTTKAIPSSTSAVEEGKKSTMITWCKGCKADAAKITEPAKAAAKAPAKATTKAPAKKATTKAPAKTTTKSSAK